MWGATTLPAAPVAVVPGLHPPRLLCSCCCKLAGWATWQAALRAGGGRQVGIPAAQPPAPPHPQQPPCCPARRCRTLSLYKKWRLCWMRCAACTSWKHSLAARRRECWSAARHPQPLAPACLPVGALCCTAHCLQHAAALQVHCIHGWLYSLGNGICIGEGITGQAMALRLSCGGWKMGRMGGAGARAALRGVRRLKSRVFATSLRFSRRWRLFRMCHIIS